MGRGTGLDIVENRKSLDMAGTQTTIPVISLVIVLTAISLAYIGTLFYLTAVAVHFPCTCVT